MRKILISIVLIFSLTVFSAYSLSSAVNDSLLSVSDNFVDHERTLADLQAKGLKVIENQSFPAELENWGKVRFISGINNNPRKVSFYLVGDNGEIVYSFPEFYGNQWIVFKLRAVAFTDVNHDGLSDVIIIAESATGFGSRGADLFPVASIYYQKGKEYVNDPKIDEQINSASKNKNIDMVLEYMEEKTPQF